MPAELTLTIEGSSSVVAAGTTGTDLFDGRRDIVAMRVNGELVDLAHAPADSDVVEPVAIESADGLNILRHSSAHVVAQALQSVIPDAQLGIGPPIEDGFYYDFAVPEALTPEDLKKIEKKAKEIVKRGQKFVRREVTDDEARAELAGEPFKLELIADKGGASDDDGSSVEVGAGGLTMYDNVDPKSGETIWKDLCRGPHLPTTKLIGNGFAVTRSSAAYWRGDQDNASLQRVYGTAWPTKDELVAYRERLAEAERRDHRKLGAELDLFSFPDELGSGLPVFHPNGSIIRQEMENYSRQRHIEAGYQFAYTPHITKGQLYEVSGHLDWYADGMFPPMHVDEEKNADGTIKKPGQDYYLKPMNCPMHCLVFDARGRSYRELPMRLFEFGSVYRYEKSGVIHGLTRVRGMTQDDAHIFVTEEQVQDELKSLLGFVLALLRDFGLDDFYLELSTRNEDKYVGSDEIWSTATAALEESARDSGLDLVPDPGGAAFYGPKISVQAKDAIGRTWQMSTIQLDFNTPARFDLQYTAADGSRKQPIMIHRALFGSIERFFGVLTEHYAGAFPVWLSPVQVVGVPVAGDFAPYLHEIAAKLRSRGVRVEIDDSDDRMQKKIRTHTKRKIPYLLIAGGEDQEAGAVSFRYRDGRQDNGVPIDEAVDRIVESIAAKAQV